MKKPMLSEHFSFDELTGSDKFPGLVEKNRLEAGAFTGKLGELCRQLLEPIRAQFGPVVITSGYRCPALNAAIGGVSSSQHAVAEAADFIVPGRDLEDVFKWIRGADPEYGQLLEYGQVILEPGWIHISLGVPYRPDAKCQEALIYDGHIYRKA